MKIYQNKYSAILNYGIFYLFFELITLICLVSWHGLDVTVTSPGRDLVSASVGMRLWANVNSSINQASNNLLAKCIIAFFVRIGEPSFWLFARNS